MKIKSIKKIDPEVVYDIKVEDNHNFFADGVLVHNCDQIRGLMKKLGKADKKQSDLDKWNEVIKRFLAGAQKNGISPREAKMVANDMLKMSSYSFNKCFSGDMKIDRDNSARWSPTIEEMYLTMNDLEWSKENNHRDLHYKYKREGYAYGFSLNDNGRLYKNKIKNISFTGKRRVYQIFLENEKNIEITSNHKFPVLCENEIVYKTIDSGLKKGDLLFFNAGYELTEFKGRYNFTDKNNETREFKSAIYYGEGSENTGYINGENIKFKENKSYLIEKVGEFCPLCMKKMNRKECHHIDGNRHNNEIENLIILCPSCHKKEDYKLGRNKKGSKGLLSLTSKIIEIKIAGDKNTYDIEMEHPYHTVSVNGIVAQNSHSTAYTYIAAQTLYLSCYFRKYFYASVLHYEVGRDKYLLDRLKAVKSQGFNILPPDVNKSKASLAPVAGEEDAIIFGLFDIKGIGEAPAKKIIELQPFSSLIDFIIRIQGNRISITVIKALVAIGAFESVHPDIDRKRLFETLMLFWKKKGAVKVPEKLEALWEKTLKETETMPDMVSTFDDYREFEKKSLGFNFFVSPYTEKLLTAIVLMEKKGLIYPTLGRVKKSSAKVPILINKIKVLNDRNGNEMAFLDIEDKDGESVSIPVFHTFWDVLKNRFIEGKIHLVNLYIDQNDQIMLGRKGYVKKKAEMDRMVKRLDHV